jgi:hypothetical protein
MKIAVDDREASGRPTYVCETRIDKPEEVEAETLCPRFIPECSVGDVSFRLRPDDDLAHQVQSRS